MILSLDQRKVFLRVFDSLVAWVGVQYGLSDESVESCIASIWGEQGSPALIDYYVAANPLGLPASELELALSWKISLSGIFAASRFGQDVVLTHGGYAFAVNGIDVEIDELTPYFPTLVRTTIVPFYDRLIVIGIMTSLDIGLGFDGEEDIEDEAAALSEDGRLVMTPEQFVHVVPLAKERQQEMDAAMFAHQTELDMNADELSEDQHVGLLAGMDWDERTRMIEEVESHAQEMRRHILLDGIRRVTRHGRLAITLEDLYSDFTKDQLIRIAAKRDAPGDLASIIKAQLVASIVETERLESSYIIEQSLREGLTAVTSLKRLVDAQGKLSIEKSSINDFEELPFPLFPYIQLYERANDVVAVMPTQVLEALQDVDWDVELVVAEEMWDAIAGMVNAVNYRGCVAVDELLSEIEDIYDIPMDTVEFMRTILYIMESPNAPLCVLADSYRRTYFVHPYLEMQAERSPETNVLETLVRRQEEYPARSVEEMSTTDQMLHDMRDVDSYRELVCYLDAHVPNGESDYTFANRLADDIVMMLRFSFNMHYLYSLFDLNGFDPSESQFQKLVQLITNLNRDVPQWKYNGWSETELRRYGEPGEFDPLA